mmetsp:Transcript_185/g.320  ORF Transcript_185/g.320 Transcript_185/m.320 type:complete len:404 (-) Transcript_185:1658-2869(-)
MVSREERDNIRLSKSMTTSVMIVRRWMRGRARAMEAMNSIDQIRRSCASTTSYVSDTRDASKLATPAATDTSPLRVISSPAANVLLVAVEIDANGNKSAPMAMQKSDMVSELRLNLRDLRMVDPSFRYESSAVLARKTAVIVRLEHVRAVIQHNRVLLFDPANPSVKPLVTTLMERAAAKAHPLPFEFRVLEGMLVNVCSTLNRQLRTLMPAIESTLDTLASNTTFGSDNLQQALDRLLPLENSLNEFSVKVAQIRESFNEVLMSDEDMCEMYLTTKAVTGHQRKLDQHEELEMMFETYLKQVDSILNELTSTLRAVKSTEHVTQIRLDAMRNKILRLEVYLNLTAISLSSGTLLVGLFGMNLLSGYEEDHVAFYTVAAASIGVSMAVFRLVLSYLRLRRIFQ